MNKKEKVLKKSDKDTLRTVSKDDNLLKLESEYCSWGDTVHYSKELNIFDSAEGVYLYDKKGTEFLDLQMWYSAVNFGYRNERLNSALKNI